MEQTRGSRHIYGEDVSALNLQVPYPAANLYEATYLMAVAINETIQAAEDVTDGELLARRLWNRTFPSNLIGKSEENGSPSRFYDNAITQCVSDGVAFGRCLF